ncbi:unnamed protein product [Ceratitis capitata]|uniref:(Mediterranean fruit fly) hypothetical protein n=1 Tax=Ceratitis capitata TaxID=7213 RepID=A0A811UCD6_CERCA|nr:unnamed protein product [Ceratitis capitata]
MRNAKLFFYLMVALIRQLVIEHNCPYVVRLLPENARPGAAILDSLTKILLSKMQFKLVSREKKSLPEDGDNSETPSKLEVTVNKVLLFVWLDD